MWICGSWECGLNANAVLSSCGILLETNVFSWIRTGCDFESPLNNFRFRGGHSKLDVLWGSGSRKYWGLCSNWAEQSSNGYVDIEMHVFQNWGLIYASPLNLIWDQILNSAEKISHSSNSYPAKINDVVGLCCYCRSQRQAGYRLNYQLVPNSEVFYQIMNKVNDRLGLRSWLYVNCWIRRILW